MNPQIPLVRSREEMEQQFADFLGAHVAAVLMAHLGDSFRSIWQNKPDQAELTICVLEVAIWALRSNHHPIGPGGLLRIVDALTAHPEMATTIKRDLFTAILP